MVVLVHNDPNCTIPAECRSDANLQSRDLPSQENACQIVQRDKGSEEVVQRFLVLSRLHNPVEYECHREVYHVGSNHVLGLRGCDKLAIRIWAAA